jgi:hypothetical protein
MITPSTQIVLNSKEVVFTNATNHGVQLIRVDMSLHSPTIWASAVSMEDTHIIYRPLSLTYAEIQEFFNRAKTEWSRPKG